MRGTVVFHLLLSHVATTLSPDTSVDLDTGFRFDLKNPVVSPCRYKQDPVYNDGTLVDCRNLGLTNIHPAWFPASASTIILGGNSLSRLENFSFNFSQNLRELDLSSNGMSSVAEYAFWGLNHLEFLIIENNQLNLDQINPLVFRGLSNLTSLFLDTNDNKERKGHYPQDMLLGLTKLQSLSLDTFAEDLNFGSLFKDLTNLSTLVLTGGTYRITNETFLGFERVPLQSLKLYLYLSRGIQANAFKYLTYLNMLSINHANLGVANALNCLFPFQNRNFTSLIFDKIAPRSNIPKAIAGSAIVTPHTARFLSKICVKHFALVNSRVFFVEIGVFMSLALQNCLETLDLSENPLLGDEFAFSMLYMFKNLKSIKLKDCKVNKNEGTLLNLEAVSSYRRGAVISTGLTEISDGFIGGCFQADSLPGYPSINITKKSIRSRQQMLHLRPWKATKVETRQSARNWTDGKIILRSPPNMKYFQFSSCLYLASIEQPIIFENAKNIEHFDFSDNNVKNITHSIYGLTNVSFVDLSYNDGQHMSHSFLDTFPTVRHLRLAGMNLNNSLILLNGARFFRHLTQLEIIDLSANGLSSLDPKAFNNCPTLMALDLSRNRFTFISIYWHMPPKLLQLNMSHNSIVSLTEDEMNFLDDHIKQVPGFSMQLIGNLMSCGCSNLKFMVWLKYTKVNLDHGRDYPCINQNDNLVSTKFQMDNLQVLSRLCNGHQAFYVSMILWTLVILLYMAFFFFLHFQTFIVSGIVNLFTLNFTLKRPKDHRYGVFIGYSEEDYRFACFSLRRFLEDELHLPTYVRHRDLLPASDVAESIMEAMTSSWRVLLLVTDHFLHHDQWAFFTLRAAVYCLDSLNPGKVVIIAERGCLERVPRSLLRVVPEHCIMELDKPFQLELDERHFLKTAVNI